MTHMAPKRQDPKIKALRSSRTLNSHPETVHDPAFHEHEFFDARDIVQVKYEMLRRHRLEGASVTEVAQAFGTSRQAFYNAQESLVRHGIAGLIPKTRGPREAHKCTEEVLDFVEQWRASVGPQGEQDLVEAIRERFAIIVHPRSIDRALSRRKKKRPAKSKSKR